MRLGRERSDAYYRGNAVTGSRKLRDAILSLQVGVVATEVVEKRVRRPKRRSGRGRPPLPQFVNFDIVKIQLSVADHFRLTPEALVSQCRQPHLAKPRQIAMYLARGTGASFPEVGRHFRRDHTTVIHACRTVPFDAALSAAAQDIRERLAA